MAQQTATTQVQHVPDWPTRGEDRLLRSWDRPRIRALVEALGEGAQLQEELAWDLLVSTGLDEATGDALDQWGALVGEQRLGLADNDYRQFILARMLVNRSSGTVDELVEILEVAAAPVLDVQHQDNLPAGIYLVVTRNTWLTEGARRRVARLMEAARPAGRHVSVIESLPLGFGFADDPDAGGYDEGTYSRLIRLE